MAATSFYHGVTTVLVDTGPRTIAVPSTSVVGIADTYTPGPDLVAPNVPVRITSEYDAAAAFGETRARRSWWLSAFRPIRPMLN